MCGGKIFKPIWVGLSVGKVRSVCVKLQRNCLPFFGRLLVVGSVVLRLLVTADCENTNFPHPFVNFY